MEKLIFRTSQAELPEDSGNDTLTVLMYCNSDDTTKVPNLYVGKNYLTSLNNFTSISRAASWIF